MKRMYLLVALGMLSITAMAQSQETQQLVLNVEKLSQLKNILRDMKRGYEVVSKGYNAVRDISKGNFSLHQVFLDGLMLVSPEVRKYHKVAVIIRLQSAIVSEYKNAFSRFRSSGSFRPEELDYLSDVYTQLFKQSLQNLDQLATVITASQLRMNDQERLLAIDQIFADTGDKLSFLRDFNQQVMILAYGRKRDATTGKDLLKLYGNPK